MAAAASVLVIAALFFVSFKTDLLKNTSFANLNPFAKEIDALYQPDSDAAPGPDNDATKDNVRDLIASNSGRNDTTRYLNIIINGSFPIVVSLQQEDKTTVAKTKTNTRRSSGHFHVIGGAFSIPENADKFLAKLRSQGFDAQIIDKKLLMVSYGSFVTREAALQAMEKIRAVQQDVWLMRQ